MDELAGVDLESFGATYSVAKRVNQLRVEQAAVTWGKRGGRVVSISPGIISTPMTHQELAEGAGEQMRGMLEISPVPRIGTAEDIASAVQWLASADASFVSGCDLRVVWLGRCFTPPWRIALPGVRRIPGASERPVA